jgi:hypothetical protein
MYIVSTLTGLLVLGASLICLLSHPDSVHASPVNNKNRQSPTCAQSGWDLTMENWNDSSTDAWLSSYVESLNGTDLLSALKAQFLPQNRDFDCGINQNCIVGDCDCE